MDAFPVADQAVVLFDERVLRAAVTAYLGRYRGESRVQVHTGSDLKVFLTWCAGRELDPLKVGRERLRSVAR
jgi:integrase/recombinase XerD